MSALPSSRPGSPPAVIRPGPSGGPGGDASETDHDAVIFCPLAGGSSGNSVYLSCGGRALLIDAGISGKAIETALAKRNLSVASLEAIIVSHEHRDHITGVGVMNRRYGLPVHISERTFQAAEKTLGRMADVRHFRCGKAFSAAGMQIRPFCISHDAADPAGFVITAGATADIPGMRIGIATDLGIVTRLVRTQLRGCRLLYIESNHDPAMLQYGPYPWHLKQRIRGRSGHLSNKDTAELLTDIAHEGLTDVVLAHLSEENNRPDLAKSAAAAALDGREIRIHLALRNGMAPVRLPLAVVRED